MPLLPLRLRLVSKSRLLIGLLATAAVLQAFGLFPSDARAADAPTETLELHPGDNFVGWVAEPILIDDLFDQIPASKLVYTWDADVREYRYAIRDIGGSLKALQPGMAANIRIFGSDSVTWERSLAPAKGMVTLYSGENWVAWNGRDEWPLDQVARGIGKSLISLEVEERGIVFEPNGVQTGEAVPRGAALRVTVDRNVRWFQPTGIMPDIVLYDNISHQKRKDYQQDVAETLNYYATEYGIEADTTRFKVHVHKNVNSYVQWACDGVSEAGPCTRRAKSSFINNRRAWVVDERIHCKGEAWAPGSTNCALWHEYFHVLQHQYKDRSSLQWIIEGSAEWISIPDPLEAMVSSAYVVEALQHGPELQSVKGKNHGYQYRLGHVAFAYLVERAGADSVIELFRQGNRHMEWEGEQWEEVDSFERAFERAFGLSIDAFYVEFAAWRSKRFGWPQDADEAEQVVIEGRLHDANGDPRGSAWVEWVEVDEHVLPGDDPRRFGARTKADGTWQIQVTPEVPLVGRVILGSSREQIADDCTLWIGDSDIVYFEKGRAAERTFTKSEHLSVDIMVPSGFCELELRGVLIDSNRKPVPHALVNLNSLSAPLASTSTDSEGRFAFNDVRGEYKNYILMIDLGVAKFYCVDGGVGVFNELRATTHSAYAEDTAATCMVPPGLKLQTIEGLFVDPGLERVGQKSFWSDFEIIVYPWLLGPPNSYPVATTDILRDGSFELILPAGKYHLVGPCGYTYSPNGRMARYKQSTAGVLAVDNEKGSYIEWRIPADELVSCDR